MDHADILRRFIRILLICVATYLMCTAYLNLNSDKITIIIVMNLILFMLIDTFYPRVHYQYDE